MGLKQMEPTAEEVGGIKFYITPFPAFKAANLTGELASVLAPLLGALAPLVESAGDAGSGSLMDVDARKAAEAMANCTALDGDRLEKLARKLLTGGNIAFEEEDENGNREPRRLDTDLANELFCGEVQDMFVLCFHVIKLNFNGFFKKLATQFGKEKSGVAKIPRKIL